MNQKYAPIALFVYNRPWHTRQTAESLQKNKLAAKSKLFIFSDGPKNIEDKYSVDEVRKYITGIKGFKQVILVKRKAHHGLAKSIIDGVNRLLSDYDRIIVLEDDLITSSFFLEYMNEALERFKKKDKVMQISGYMFPVETHMREAFFLPFTTSWGWATWKRAWKYFITDSSYLLKEIEINRLEKQFNLNDSYPYVRMLRNQINGKIDSWAIRWYASVFLKKGLVLYPNKSLVQNIGNDASGTHSGKSMIYRTTVSKRSVVISNITEVINDTVFKNIQKYIKSKVRQ